MLRSDVVAGTGDAEKEAFVLSIRWLRVRVPSPSLDTEGLTTNARDVSAREVGKLPEFGNALGTLREQFDGTVTRNPPAGWQPDEGISGPSGPVVSSGRFASMPHFPKPF